MQTVTTHFNAARFMRLLRAHWAEKHRNFLHFWLAVAGINALPMFLMLIVGSGMGGRNSFQSGIYWPGLIISGLILSTLHFSALRKPESTLVLLTRPASILEKWLLAAFFILIVWPLAYTLSATAINIISSIIGYQLDTTYKISPSPPAEKTDYLPFVPFISTIGKDTSAFAHLGLLQIYAGLCGFALLGSIYFRKNPGIKIAAVAFVIFQITLLLTAITFGQMQLSILSWWTPQTLSANLLFRQWISNLLFWLAVPALLWLSALRALYEKDVA